MSQSTALRLLTLGQWRWLSRWECKTCETKRLYRPVREKGKSSEFWSPLAWVFSWPGLVLLGIGLFALGYAAGEGNWAQHITTWHWESRLAEAQELKDSSGQIIALRHLIRDPDVDPQRILELADMLWVADNKSESFKIARRVAPADRAGYAPAHRWMATKLIKEGETETDEQLKIACHHLEMVLQVNAADLESRKDLIRLNVKLQNSGEIERNLVEAARVDGRYFADLFKFYRAREDTKASSIAASKSIRYLREQVTEHPGDLDLAKDLSKFLASSGQFREAEQVMLGTIKYKQGAQKQSADTNDSQNPPHLDDELKKYLIGLYLYECSQLPYQTRAEYEQQKKLLTKAYQLDPTDQRVLDQLALISLSTGRQRPMPELLKPIYESGNASVQMLFALGTKFLLSGDYDEAIRQFELGQAKEPLNPLIANNLAMAQMRSGDKEKLLAARDTIAIAAKQLPDNPFVLETRGQINFRLGLTDDALADLHQALIGMPENSDIFKTLSKIYAAKDLPELARIFANRAKAIDGE